jgi:predicted ATPase
MIRSAKITNFRCLRDVEVTFEPLTVLVGPNASGKTTLLQALTPDASWGPSETWQKRGERPVEIALSIDGRGLVALPSGGLQYRVMRLDLEALRRPNQVHVAHELSADGANLTSAFATLPRTSQAEVARQLCGLVPVFSDVDAPPFSSGHLRLRFRDRWAPSVDYSPNDVSDGTMLVMALLVLQHQKTPVDVLAIEEPERGLHPWLLGEVIKVLRAMTKGEGVPRKMQIILATHSAELLEFVEPHEVRFFGRDTTDGSVRVQEAPTRTPEWCAAFDEYRRSLGEAWLSGGLGGVPGA